MEKTTRYGKQPITAIRVQIDDNLVIKYQGCPPQPIAASAHAEKKRGVGTMDSLAGLRERNAVRPEY